MCGITGYIGTEHFFPNTKKIKSCLNMMKDRGPDFQNFKSTNLGNKKILFLFSRLSIIDISKKSNKIFEDEKGLLIFNGEIYNYKDLIKNHLKNELFSTNCDSEVLLKILNLHWTKAINMLDGMWAFAYYSKKRKKVLISRDNFGEKPLFFSKTKKGFFFASNTGFIRKISSDNFSVNQKKVNLYLKYGFRSFGLDDSSFFKNIYELKSGHSLIIDDQLNIKTLKNFLIKKKLKLINNNNYNKLIKKTIIESVKTRSNADCKVGLLLSGGIDSNLIAHTIKKILKKSVQTYSLEFSNDKKNQEEKNIESSTKILKGGHKYVKIKKFNLKEVIQITKKIGSPISAPNFLLYYRLHQQAKKDNCKVVMNGFGADEVFAGYFSHHIFYILSNYKNTKIKYLIENFKKNFYEILQNPKLKNLNNLIINFKKIKNINFYLQDILARKKFLKLSFKDKDFLKKYSNDYFKNHLLNDLFKFYLPSQLLDADSLAMINSIENRSPFLNLKLLKQVLNLKNECLINNGYGKYILRTQFKNIIPKQILQNKNKVGFNCDVKDLFNFKNKELIRFLISNKKIKKIINIDKIMQILNKKKLSNSESHFIFALISTNAFLNSFAK